MIFHHFLCREVREMTASQSFPESCLQIQYKFNAKLMKNQGKTRKSAQKVMKNHDL